MSPPPILGGQGRNEDDIRRDAGHLLWAIVVGIALLACALVARCSQ